MLLQYFYVHYRLFQITNTIVYWIVPGPGTGLFVLGAALYRALRTPVLSDACDPPFLRIFNLTTGFQLYSI